MKKFQNYLLAALMVSPMACKADVSKESALLDNEKKEISVKEHSIKVALLLDTSNSMDGLIDQAKAQLWKIVNELSYATCENQRPNLQIAVYEYGNDNLNARDGYVRKIIGFTHDLDEVSKGLFSLTTNGGSEYCGTIIQTSLDGLDWGNDADDLKMIFIAGNEPFDQGDIHYKDAIANAKEKSIVVNTIFCGDYAHGVATRWKDGADIGYGEYLAINQNRKIIHIVSPYDDAILQLNIRLNDTYIPYGHDGEKKIALQAEQDENAMGYSAPNAVGRAVVKSSHLYKNASWDLVDAEAKDNFSYDKLKKGLLPEKLQEMTKGELKSYIEKQRTEREHIQNEIQGLNEKRQRFILAQQPKSTTGLGSAMLTAIKKQAAEKGYVWE